MKEGRTTGGLIPIKGYVGNHGYNDAAQMMKSIMAATDYSYVRPKFEAIQIVYEVENCERAILEKRRK